MHLLQLSLRFFLAGLALQPLREFFRQLLLQVHAVVDRLRECFLTALARDKCGKKRRLRLSLSQMHQNKQAAGVASRTGLSYLKVRAVQEVALLHFRARKVTSSLHYKDKR